MPVPFRVILSRAVLSRAALGGALCLAAGPLMAQAPDCGGLGAAGTWIGGGPETSDPLLAEGAMLITGSTVPLNGAAVALFSLAEPSMVRLEARAGALGGDPVIDLYDAAGRLVATDDDSGGGLASRLETELPAGSYCLAVRGFGGTELAADISVGLLEHLPLTEGLSGGFFDPGFDGGPEFVGIDPCTSETPATALGSGPLDALLGAGGTSAIATVTEVPYYRFTLAEPQGLTIRAENEDADPYIYLFDGAGTLIAENDDYDSLNSRLDFVIPLPAGTYCVGMRALFDPELPVTLRIQPYDAEAELAERIAVGDAAPPLDGSWPVRPLGLLPPVSVRDLPVQGRQAQWLSFDLDMPTVLVIDATGLGDADPVIILYDAAGTELAFNDDSNGTLDSQILIRLEAGRYLLAVRHFSDWYSGTIRVATERFVRASE
jgi:hypothetical protein